jgi:hypothetical protein
MSSLYLTFRGLAVTGHPQAGDHEAAPDWALFWAFPIAFGVAVVLLTVAACLAYRDHTTTGKGKGKWNNQRVAGWWLREQLRVGAKWTLKDSWASNVTVIAAAFAGVFGSSGVVTALLGSSGNAILGLATVSAAVAVGAVGTAPLLLQIFQVDGDVTPAGLLLGAAVTMGATGGELAVICLGTRNLPLGGLQYVLPWVGLIFGGLILAIYAFTNMTRTLTANVRKRAAKGAPPRPLNLLSDKANALLAEFHTELADDHHPVDMVASAYEESIETEPPAGVF